MAGHRKEIKNVDMVAVGQQSIPTSTIALLTKHLDNIPESEKKKISNKTKQIAWELLEFLHKKAELLNNPATEGQCEARDKTRLPDVSQVIIAMTQMQFTFSNAVTAQVQLSGGQAQEFLRRLTDLERIIESGAGPEAELAAKTVLALTGQEIPEAVEVEAQEVG